MLAAAALYLMVGVWVLRPALRAPSEMLPFPAVVAESPALDHSDQLFVVSTVVRNATRLLSRPWALFDSGQCYPMANAATLGEHGLGEGLLAVVPWLVTRDPVITYNVVILLTIWIPGLTMYALVYYWTRSVAAASVSGLLFAFAPWRVIDPSHPFVHGNQWIPAALLFAHRVFAYRRWRDAAWLTLFVCLQLLESLYPLTGLAILGSVYGLYLTVRYARRFPALIPKLLAVAAVSGSLAVLVLGPYLRSQATWGILKGRDAYAGRAIDFAYGGLLYPGSVALCLMALGLLDRLRGARRSEAGYDPRLVFLGAGLILACSPWVYSLARGVVPGVDAVRAFGAVRYAVLVVVAFLAGYGMAALVEGRGAMTRRAVTGVVLAAALIETFCSPLIGRPFEQAPNQTAWRVRPPDELIALYRGAGSGAVLDLPFNFSLGAKLHDMSYYIFMGAYHGQPVAACYNSFEVPLQRDIAALAMRLPDPAAADALYALGFRTVMVHEELLFPRQRGAYAQRLSMGSGQTRLRPVGSTASHEALRFESDVPIEIGFGALAPADDGAEPVDVAPPGSPLGFAFVNRSAATYRHPDPIVPTPMLVRWRTESGDTVRSDTVRFLLPIALARGDRAVRHTIVPVPSTAGVYQVTVAPVASPDAVLARQMVRVRVPTASPGVHS
jgi:hypothetical protein